MSERNVRIPLSSLVLAALQPRFRDHRRPWLGVRGDRPTKHVYQATVADHVVARRRAANKVARRSRRVNRMRTR